MIKGKDVYRLTVPESIKHLCGIRDELILIGGKRIYRGKFDLTIKDEQRMQSFVHSHDFISSQQYSVVSSTCLSSSLVVNTHPGKSYTHQATVKGRLSLSEIQYSIENMTPDQSTQWLKLTKIVPSFIETKHSGMGESKFHIDLSIKRQPSYNQPESRLDTGKTGRTISNSRLHRQSESQSNDRHLSRVSSGVCLDDRPADQSIAERRQLTGIARVEDFQSKLKQQMKHIEQRYNHPEEPVGRLNASDLLQETQSTILAPSGQLKRQIDSILSEWQDTSFSRQSPKRSKYESIRMLIEGKSYPPPTEGLLKQESSLTRINSSTPLNDSVLDKKAKFDKIKASLNKINGQPMDMMSNKETIEYELSDGDFSEGDRPDVAERQYPEEIAEEAENWNSRLENEVDHDDVKREPKDVFHVNEQPSHVDIQLDNEDYKFDVQEQDYNTDGIGASDLYLNDTNRSRIVAHRYTKDESHKVGHKDNLRLFCQVLDQKVNLIIRVKRRNVWRAFLEGLRSSYLESMDDEKSGQCQEILTMLALDMKRQVGRQIYESMVEFRQYVHLDRAIYLSKSLWEYFKKRQAMEVLFELTYEEQVSRLDVGSIRKVLIVTKTIVHQKRYITFHQVFGKIRKISEERRLQIKPMISALLAIQKRLNFDNIGWALGHFQLNSKFVGFTRAFENQMKFNVLSKMCQFNFDRSLLGCTASDITLVRDESMEISKGRYEKKFHLVQYIQSQLGSGHNLQGDRANRFARLRREKQHNTLEDIRNELSQMHGRKLDDYSGFSKKSDQSKAPVQVSSFEKPKKAPVAPPSPKKNDPNKVFSNEKLIMLVANAGIQDIKHKREASLKAEQSYDESRPRSSGVQERLIEIKLIDDNAKRLSSRRHSTTDRNGDTDSRHELGTGACYRTQEDRLPAIDQISDIDPINFRLSSNEMTARLRDSQDLSDRKSPADLFGVFDQRPVIDHDGYERVSDVRNEDQVPDIAEDRPQREYLRINSGLIKDGSTPNLIENIRTNFNELQKIYQQASEVPDNLESIKKPSEHSLDEASWPVNKLPQGYNFIEMKPKDPELHPAKESLKNRLRTLNRSILSTDKSRDSIKKKSQIFEKSSDVIKSSSKSKALSHSKRENNQLTISKLQSNSKFDHHPDPEQTKNNPNFRNFFKKLDKNSKAPIKHPVSSPSAGGRLPDSIVKYMSPSKHQASSEYALKTVIGSDEKANAKSTNRLAHTVNSLAGIKSSYETGIKSSSLIDRLQQHIKSPSNNDKQHLSKSIVKNHSSSINKTNNSAMKPELNSADKNRPSGLKRGEFATSSFIERSEYMVDSAAKKPAIKIKDRYNKSLSNTSANKLYASERSPYRPPLIPKVSQTNNLVSSQLSIRSRENSQKVKNHIQLNTSAKSNRTLSAMSDTSKRLDNSNDGYRERYQDVKTSALRGNNYGRIADARKRYNSRDK